MDTDLQRKMRALVLPNCASPVLAKVVRANEGPGITKYSVDCRVLTAGTLEETDQLIADVPISPLWIGKKGKGIYAPPPAGAIVIIEFIGWNIGFPFVAGYWSDNYEAGVFRAHELMITDGDGLQFGVDGNARFMFATKQKSLKAILEKIIDEIAALQTQGAPPQHVVSPVSLKRLLAIKQDIAQLLQ